MNMSTEESAETPPSPLLQSKPTQTPVSRVLSLSFNQDFECFVAGCEDGFRVFNTHPLREIERCNLGGGVAIAEMLFRSNYVALVGGGPRPAFPPNKVVVWDCSLNKAVIELEACAEQRVVGVRLRREWIVVVEEGLATAHSFSDIPRQIRQWRTWPNNPRGLVALANSDENPLIAFPSSSGEGMVDVGMMPRPAAGGREAAEVMYESSDGGGRGGKKVTTRFRAHSHPLQAITFNHYGTLVATASEKGTLVRVFDATKGTMLRELRRGSNAARISCINFSLDSKLLCVSSNHATIHVFSVQKTPSHTAAAKSLSLRLGLERYLKGDISFTRLRVASKAAKSTEGPLAPGARGAAVLARSRSGSYPHTGQEQNESSHPSPPLLSPASGTTAAVSSSTTLCAFDRDCESIVVLSHDGGHQVFCFNQETGGCKQTAYCLFTELHSIKNSSEANVDGN